MKKQVIAAAVLCALVSSAAFAQQAKEGPWMVRVRAVNLESANGDTTGLGLSIDNKVIPEVDFSYFFSKNLAVELVLTVPQKQTLHSSLLGKDIGTLYHLPPTVTLQYHFDVKGVKPYVGAGINYTHFSSVDVLGGAATIDKNSWGPALQAGVDIPLSGNMYLNVDVKKVYIRTDVHAGGANLGTFKIDPVLFGVGLGWRF
ncbi:MAG: OmpW family protein [Polaromonas sp.]|uniref:OmpW/AlkL family protein n=1 Tax=Polaromonas sp. TaxID=1869339 RepID=UPI00185A414E|nr:OmpW family outer membrane protein [Polaromonas sp.]NMM10606.1 OmpW family protein [Polaromonas sp.]